MDLVLVTVDADTTITPPRCTKLRRERARGLQAGEGGQREEAGKGK